MEFLVFHYHQHTFVWAGPGAPAFKYLLREEGLLAFVQLFLGCYICSHVNQLVSSLPSRRKWQYLLLVSNTYKSLLTCFLQVCEVVCAKPNLKHKLIYLGCTLHSLVMVFWTTFVLCCQHEQRHLEIMPYLFCKFLFNLIIILLSYGL